MKNILCFGDSNTFGYNPENSGRFDKNTRWTGVLQNLLGSDYNIIEEGLNGRTTVVEDDFNFSRNGRRMFYGCLHTHKPLDLVIICLGTNDLKKRFNLSAKDVMKGMEELIKIAKTIDFEDIFKPIPKILIMSPIRIDRDIQNMKDASYNLLSVEYSEELPKYYKDLSTKYNIDFFDLGSVAVASKVDYVHMNAENHKKIANALNIKIRDINL